MEPQFDCSDVNSPILSAPSWGSLGDSHVHLAAVRKDEQAGVSLSLAT